MKISSFSLVNLFAFVGILFLSCGTAKRTVSDLAEQRMLDVAYGSFPSSKMDVYLPEGRNKKTPLVVIIHGGGWVAGDKAGDRGSQHILMKAGIASININYRFADSLDVHYPEILADIDTAVGYCVQRSKEWNTRRRGLVLMGASAGGHLSLLYAYTTSRKVDAIISESAPVDFTDTTMLDAVIQEGLLGIIEKLAGVQYIPGQPIAAEFAAASPLVHMKKIPTLIFHGTHDETVPYREAVKLRNRMDSLRIPHKLIPIEGAGHDLNMRDPSTRELIYDEIIAWINKYNS